MIQYDYKIVRRDDQIGEYVPDKIPKELPNLVFIEGPNSIGKSTLLHIISLGLHGLKNSDIPVPLINKMKNLMEAIHQDLIFNFTISTNDKSLKLIAEKPNMHKRDIMLYEIRGNKKRNLTPQLFKQNYKLIYDIPFNPTDRLNSLMEHIENEQKSLGTDIRQFRMRVNEIISEIKKSDPSKLKNEQDRLKKLLKQKNDMESIIPKLEKDLDFLKKTFYFSSYSSYTLKVQNLTKEVEKLAKSITRKTKKIKKDKDQLTGIIQNTRSLLFQLKDLRDEALDLFKLVLTGKFAYLVDMWNNIDFLSTIQDCEFDENLSFCIMETEKILNNQEQNIAEKDTYKVLKFYRDLVNILETNKDLNVELPGMTQSVNEFIDDLKKIINEKRSFIIKIENIREAKKQLIEIINSRKTIDDNYLPKIDDLRDEIEELSEEKKKELKEYEKSEELNQKRKNLTILKKKKDIYEKRLHLVGNPPRSEVGIIGQGNLSDFGTYTEDKLNKYIETQTKSIEDKKAKLHKLESHIEISKSEIQKLSEIKPHKYQQYKEDLENLLNILTKLEKKINVNFKKYLEVIKEQKKGKITKDQKKYNYAVFQYLGNLLEKVYHIDRYYMIESIDLLEGVMNTKSGDIIRLGDMGTGQSQSAYLRSILETSENKVLIALFDEISHMDERSLEPIYNRLRELHANGQLLLGILVQMRTEGVRITDISEKK